MNCACNLHLRLAVKTKQQKNINIYTYTYIFEKPFDCIFAWKIKKTKTNPISITTVTPLLSKDQNLTKRKKSTNQILLFFASKNHHNFFSIFVPHPSPLRSYLTNYQIFHHQKNWEKSILCPISPPLILPLPAINKTIFKFNSIHYN